MAEKTLTLDEAIALMDKQANEAVATFQKKKGAVKEEIVKAKEATDVEKGAKLNPRGIINKSAKEQLKAVDAENY
jgi:hypothetical protein